jgi:cell division protein FtsB
MFSLKTFLSTKKILFLGLIIGSFLVFNLIRLIYLNVTNERRISSQKNEVLSLKAAVQKLENDKLYYSSDQYLETEARDKLQLTKPDETIIVVPENVQKELVKTETQKILGVSATGIRKLSNLEQWLELFLGKGQVKKFNFDF